MRESQPSLNLDRLKKDLAALVEKGERLELVIRAETHPNEIEDAIKKFGDKAKHILDGLPSFATSYQFWYSEANVLIK
jgi:hypothetical protein